MKRTSIAFGKGFINSYKLKPSNAQVYPINISTGMPIVSEKRLIQSNMKKNSIKRNNKNR